MKLALHSLMLVPMLVSTVCSAADDESGFTSLSDGKSFEGWKTAEEHKATLV
jgi:hypothetical protein